MKAIVILADSVNRRHLNIYGNDWVKTPNLDRLAGKSCVFNNHWTGSAPCMPARRDMLTGRLNFLERNWGAIEPFDHTLPQILRQEGIYSHMSTDHYHYLEIGGENYCQLFDTWECFRGQEKDPWVSRVNYPDPPTHLGKFKKQYHKNRSAFNSDADYPTPKTFKAGAEWLQNNKEADDYLLWVEGFDPHEPFDVPDEYLALYDDNYDGSLYFWPDYAPVDQSPEAIEHIQKRYAAVLTMMDKYLGKILDVMDENNMWEDTMVIFTTDHGYMLGEHGFMAKNYMPAYNEVFHIPLIIHDPNETTGNKRINTLTQNIDIFPTLLEYFEIDENQCKNKVHGKSLTGLLNGEKEKLRDTIIYGYFGKSVNITDGKYTYFRAADRENNLPLNLYCSIPTTICQYYGHEAVSDFSSIEMGRYLDWTDYPVYKISSGIIDFGNRAQKFTDRGPYNNKNLLFDIEDDYLQENPIANDVIESSMLKLLKQTMIEHDSPEEQFVRLGMN